MMNGDRQSRVIAVFGSSKNVPPEVLSLAKCAGYEAATQCFIVLTGGTMKAKDPRKQQEHEKKVKNAALKGVKEAPVERPPSGYWIGVLQEGSRPSPMSDGNCADFKYDPSEDKGGIIYSDMGDQRNFLEACLCDAAIVLEGAAGTISEAVSTLCLGKPVLLCWRTPTQDRSATPQRSEEQKAIFNAQKALHQLFETRRLREDQESDLVKVTRDRLKGEHENRMMKSLIKENVRLGRVRFPEHGRLISTTGPEACRDIAGWLAELASLSPTGDFPDDLGGNYGKVKEDYDNWLNSL